MIYLVSLLFTFSAFAEPFRWDKSDVPIVKEGPYFVSEWVEVELPKGLVSFQVMATGSPDQFLQVCDLIDPKGEVYLASGAPLHAYSQPVLNNVVSLNRSEAVVKGTATLIVPNNPKLPKIHAGKWRMRTHTHNEPSVKKVDLVVVGKEKATAGRVRAKVWIAPNSYWDKNGKGEIALAGATNLLKRYGIWIESKVDRLEDAFDSPLNVPDDMGVLASTQNDKDRLNIYMMPTMENQSKPVNGISCLGGPGRIGKAHSCFAAIFASSKAGDYTPEQQAKVLAHEIAHYLGLFHTKDDGYASLKFVFDSLDDTPETITGENLMDSGISDVKPVLSPLQQKQLFLSPAVE